MTAAEYNRFCGRLPHATYVMQWGGAHVWKVAGKVFAIAWEEPGDELHVTFKVSDLSFDLMKEQPGLRPAPYLASRGMTWIQRTSPEMLDDEGLRAYLVESHRLVASGLPKRRQQELGLDTTTSPVPRAAASRRSRARKTRPSTGPTPTKHLSRGERK